MDNVFCLLNGNYLHFRMQHNQLLAQGFMKVALNRDYGFVCENLMVPRTSRSINYMPYVKNSSVEMTGAKENYQEQLTHFQSNEQVDQVIQTQEVQMEVSEKVDPNENQVGEEESIFEFDECKANEDEANNISFKGDACILPEVDEENEARVDSTAVNNSETTTKSIVEITSSGLVAGTLWTFQDMNLLMKLTFGQI